MIKMRIIDRAILLITGLLAAFQVVVGIEGKVPLALIAYTVAFGILLIAGLLLIILGFDILENDAVVILSTLIPLGLSTGLVVEYFPQFVTPYLIFVILGLIFVVSSRLLAPGKAASFFLMIVHGISGLLIFGLPIYLSLRGQTPLIFVLVGVGGGLIGIAGLLLSFLKADHPLLSRQRILQILPIVLVLTTAAFVAGFNLV